MRSAQNLNWTFEKDVSGHYSYDQAQLAVLIDIREELKAMNLKLNVLQCRDFLQIPHKLDAIKRNTNRKKKPQPKGSMKP